MDPFEQEQETNLRPAIITIFAILTIIGVAITLIGTFIPSNIFTRGFQEMPQLPAWINWIGLGLAGFKLGAAIMLLKMKRNGFFLYVIAESAAAILQIIGSRIILDLLSPYDSAVMPVPMETIVLLTTVVSLLLSLAFILVYASQLNKMN